MTIHLITVSLPLPFVFLQHKLGHFIQRGAKASDHDLRKVVHSQNEVKYVHLVLSSPLFHYSQSFPYQTVRRVGIIMKAVDQENMQLSRDYPMVYREHIWHGLPAAPLLMPCHMNLVTFSRNNKRKSLYAPASKAYVMGMVSLGMG